jgi:hypothetical protein
MKPIVILPPDTMSAEDVATLRDNGICVVVAADPAKVKFLDPIPAASCRTKIEAAAIALSRVILKGSLSTHVTRAEACTKFVELLTVGTPIATNGETEEERTERVRAWELDQETRRLARLDAKAERDAKRKKPATP